MNKDYFNFLSGKNVAIVGPANYLSKLKLGSYIDGFDVVVRVNRGMELIDRYPESLGTRTDILYNCLIDSLDNGGVVDIDFYKKSGVKWVSTIPNSKPTGECSSPDLHKMVNKTNVKDIKNNFKFHVMDHVEFNFLNEKVKCRSNTGYAAIFDLLSYGIESLFICGYSFYLDSFIPGYKDGSKRSDEVFAAQCFESKRHVQKTQWKFLKDIFDGDFMSCDAVLESILKMEDLSRDEFRKNNFYTD
jgi:hypothetical protein